MLERLCSSGIELQGQWIVRAAGDLTRRLDLFLTHAGTVVNSNNASKQSFDGIVKFRDLVGHIRSVQSFT